MNRGSAGRLPWVTSLDLKLNISYRFTKDSVLTGGLEVFNVFNRVNFGNPVTTLGATNAGAITTTNGDMRIMQFAAKFNF